MGPNSRRPSLPSRSSAASSTKRGKLEEALSVLAPLPDAYAQTLGPDHFQRVADLARLRLGARGKGRSRRRARRSTGSRWRSTRRGLSGRLDRDQIECTASHLPGPRRTVSRPRRDAVVASLLPILQMQREDTCPSPCRPTASPTRWPTRWPNGATQRTPSNFSKRCTTTLRATRFGTRLALAASAELDRRLPAPPGRTRQSHEEPAHRGRADGAVASQGPRAGGGTRPERDSTQPRAPPRVKSPHRLAELDGGTLDVGSVASTHGLWPRSIVPMPRHQR